MRGRYSVPDLKLQDTILIFSQMGTGLYTGDEQLFIGNPAWVQMERISQSRGSRVCASELLPQLA